MAAKSLYGSNPHAGRNPNANLDWGSFSWPNGVPGNLLAVVTVPGNVKIVVRAELAELVAVMYQLAWVKYGRNFAVGWTGGYENRAIAGTSTPSNHSKGKAIDNDARNNPMSYTWQCDIPPDLVHDWESFGWYWGGRYTGKTDTMHFEYCWPKAEIARHLALARAELARVTGQPAPPIVTVPKPVPDSNNNTPSRIGPAPSSAPAYPGLLKKGVMNSAGVKTMQQRLNLHLSGSHAPLITADGDFGPKTEAAVIWYQTARSLAPFRLAIDGKVGPKTWASLWQ